MGAGHSNAIRVDVPNPVVHTGDVVQGTAYFQVLSPVEFNKVCFI